MVTSTAQGCRQRRLADVNSNVSSDGGASYASNCLSNCILSLVLVYIGISLGLPGSTLIYLEKSTVSREDEIALVFCARAVGSLAGWLLCLLLLDSRNSRNPLNLLGVGVIGLCVVHLLLPWACRIWWMMCGFVFQGCFITISFQGCLNLFGSMNARSTVHRPKHVTFTVLLGCVLIPFIALPYLQTFDGLASWSPSVATSSGGLQNYSANVVLKSSNGPNLMRKIRVARAATQSPITPTTHGPVTYMTTSVTMGTSSSTVFGSSIPPGTITTTLGSVVSTEANPTKPVVNDAKHLNQDSSAADGSQTASKMKQMGEQHRIDTVADGNNHIPPVVVDMKMSTTISPINSKINTTSPSAIAEQVPKLEPSMNVSQPNVTMMKAQYSTTEPVTSTSTTPITPTATVITRTDATTMLTESTTAGRITTTNQVTMADKLNNHHSRLAEHQGLLGLSPTQLFIFPLLPVQYLYLSVGVLGLFVWLLLVPSLGWCRYSTEQSVWFLNYFKLDGIQRSDRDHVEGGEMEELQTLLPCEENAHANTGRTDNVDDTLYMSADDGSVIMNVAEAITAPVQHSMPYTLQWPNVHWPRDGWLLLAESLNVGLETTFSAFLHGFAVRYLLWTPALGFLSLSLFWLGDLVGRLPDLFVVESEFSSLTPSTLRNRRDRSCWTESYPSNLRLCCSSNVLRIFGALMCIVVTAALTHLCVLDDQNGDSNVHFAAPSSHHYIFWIGGSLVFGFGIGFSSSTSCRVDRVQDNAQRLQLAGYLGQLLIPSLVAYLHHRAVFRHISYAFNASLLGLSILMLCCLVVEVVWSLCFPSSNTYKDDSLFSNQSPSTVCEGDNSLSPPSVSLLAVYSHW